jgi:putative flippase GtrA
MLRRLTITGLMLTDRFLAKFMPNVVQLGKYLVVGILNTGVGYGIIFACMYGLGLGPVISNAVGYGVGVVVSYSVNKRFTFKSSTKDRATFLRFIVVTCAAYLSNLLTLIVAIDAFDMHEGVAQVLSGSVYVVTAFLGSKFYAFSTTCKDVAKAQPKR